jgi:outer membrane beta-barrel protein
MRLSLVIPIARLVLAVGLALGAGHGTTAWAQSNDGDDIDDILKSDDDSDKKSDDTVAKEKRELLEANPDSVASPDQDTQTPDEVQHPHRIRPIKVLQPKTFLKIGRWAITPHIGFVTNDPFVNRYLIGAGITYNPTEILGVEVSGTFSPDLGTGDYKPVTKQLVQDNQVSPDISRIMWFANVNLVFSPIYGKVAVGGKSIVNYDIFGVFGTGITQTRDDLDALQRPNDPVAQATATQIHPTSNFGGGIRAEFGQNIAVSLEGRSMIYIETVASTTLELKNSFMLLGAVSFYFPGMK